MAKQALSSMAPDGRISIKKFLYATRALMACRWIERHQSQPPTEFLAMVRNLSSANEQSQIEHLLVQKSSTDEKAEIVIDELRSAEIQSELDAFDGADLAFEKPARSTLEKLDTVLRRWAGIGSAQTKLPTVSS